MSFPPTYARAQDFTEDDAADTVELNNELDNLGTILNAVLSSLKLVQRDDGQIANASVHADAFSAVALLLMASTWTPRGTWETAAAYVVGDVVDHDPGGGTTPYVCTEDHIAGTFATDKSAGRWTQIGTAPSSLTISPFGESLIDDADAPAAQTTLGASTLGKALFTVASAAAARTSLGLEIGTHVLAPDGDGSQLTNLPTSAGTETGDVSWSFATVKAGWLKLDGKTIGSAASAASWADDSFEALFTLLWTNLANAEAPVSGGRGASAAADWSASKTLQLPDARGRYPFAPDNMGGSSAGRIASTEADKLGGSLGTESKTITTTELPSHAHGVGTLAIGSAGAHTHTVAVGLSETSNGSASSDGHADSGPTATSSDGAHAHGITGATGAAGSGNPLNILPPGLAINLFVKV